MREIVRDGLSVYRVDGEALKALDPDVIVTQDHCEVCAVSLADVEAATCTWTGRPVDIVSLRPDSIADVYADIARVARALRVPEAGERLVARDAARLEAVRSRVAGRARPRVAFIEWVEPLMAGGNWMPELIEAAGGHNLFGEAGKHSDWMQLGRPGRRRPGGDRGGAVRLRARRAAWRSCRCSQAKPGWADICRRSGPAASISPTATPTSTAPARASPTARRCWRR